MPEENNIIYQGKNVHYRIIGQGKPVLLLHGFCEDGQVWNQQINFLKTNFRLIVPDIPGSGLSAFNKQLVSMDDYAETIKAIIDSEKITDAVMIGHSMGGYITLSFIKKYPQLLKTFGLFHSSAFPDTEEKKASRLKAIDFMKANGAEAFVKTSIPGLFTDNFKKDHAKQVGDLIEKGKNFTADALIQYYHAMINRPDRTTILKNAINPVLFILGEKDNAVPLQSGLQQCYLPSQSYVNILTNSAHMGMWEDEEKANTILLQFLKSVS